jgi:hypothetical protein
MQAEATKVWVFEAKLGAQPGQSMLFLLFFSGSIKVFLHSELYNLGNEV